MEKYTERNKKYWYAPETTCVIPIQDIEEKAFNMWF